MDKPRLLSLLKSLVRINSVNPSLSPGGPGEGRLSSFLGRYMKRMGLRVEFQDVAPGRKNVVGILKGRGGGKTLILNSHTDTVGVRNMTLPPFSPKVLKGKLYGRGACDMKAGLAAQVAAVDALISEHKIPKGDVILSFVCDEEYASLGTEVFLKKYGADAALIAEATDEKILVAHKGFAWVRFDVPGRAAHGSDAVNGVDAVAKAARLISAMNEAPAASESHSLLGRSTSHVSAISGGLGWSTYPDRCVVEIEIRTLPGENPASVLRRIRKLAAPSNARPQLIFFRPAYEISTGNSVIQTLVRAHQKVQGNPPPFSGFAGWMDSALFGAAGIPCVVFGPKGAGAHAAVEWVNLASVTRTAQVLKEFIWEYCNGAPGSA